MTNLSDEFTRRARTAPRQVALLGAGIATFLKANQALTVIETLGRHDAVGAAGLMEVAPAFDHSEGTQRLAAYLLVTLLEQQFAE
jgi:agmatinase